MDKIQYRPRVFGKAFYEFSKFVAACKAGKRIIYHGREFVAMDRKSYEELVKKKEKPLVVEEQ